jgi:hypothetical protein
LGYLTDLAATNGRVDERAGPLHKAEELAESAEGLIEQGDLDGLAPVWAAIA